MEDAVFMVVKLESIVYDFLQPFGSAAKENDWSECLKLGVVRLVGFWYDNRDGLAELLRPYCVLNEAVEECPKAFKDAVRSFGVLLWVDEVFEVPPVDVIPPGGRSRRGVGNSIMQFLSTERGKLPFIAGIQFIYDGVINRSVGCCVEGLIHSWPNLLRHSKCLTLVDDVLMD